MGDASDGGEFSSPSPPNNEDEGGEGNTGGQGHPVNVDRQVQKPVFLNRL